MGARPSPYAVQSFWRGDGTNCLRRYKTYLQTSSLFLLLSKIRGTFSLSPKAKNSTAFAFRRILVCLLLQKMRCVPHIQLNFETSLSLGPALPGLTPAVPDVFPGPRTPCAGARVRCVKQGRERQLPVLIFGKTQLEWSVGCESRPLLCQPAACSLGWGPEAPLSRGMCLLGAKRALDKTSEKRSRPQGDFSHWKSTASLSLGRKAGQCCARRGAAAGRHLRGTLGDPPYKDMHCTASLTLGASGVFRTHAGAGLARVRAQ